MFDWQRFGEEVRFSGPAILAARAVPGPPDGDGPFAGGRAYPLAVDFDGTTGAVSYAALDPYPGLESGWWCVAVRFSLVDGVWVDGDQDDNTTTPRPFQRPKALENSTCSWVDWHSNGALGVHYDDPGHEPRFRHMFFGIAPRTTARLTVTDQSGRERELTVTPWCGAYVATIDGPYSRLTGFDRDGTVLGSFVCLDGPGPEPPDDPPPGVKAA